MRKWIAYILLFLVTAGTAVPCCAADDCGPEWTLAATNGDEECADACSPFSACTLCAGFTVPAQEGIAVRLLPERIVCYGSPSSSLPAPLPADWWQPPRAA